jgi:hypothetical protein
MPTEKKVLLLNLDLTIQFKIDNIMYFRFCFDSGIRHFDMPCLTNNTSYFTWWRWLYIWSKHYVTSDSSKSHHECASPCRVTLYGLLGQRTAVLSYASIRLVGVAVHLLTRIRQILYCAVLEYWPGYHLQWMKFFVVFLSPSRRMPLEYHVNVTIASFPILFKSSLTYHPIIPRYVF